MWRPAVLPHICRAQHALVTGEVKTEIFDIDLKTRGGRTLPVRLFHKVAFGADGMPGPSRTLVLSRAKGESTDPQRAAEVFDASFDFLQAVPQVSCVLVDEAQFLTRAQVLQLAELCDRHGLPVVTYGLRTDFRGELFEGSAALLGLADSLTELKATPEGAARLRNGNPGMVLASSVEYGDEAWASYQGQPVAVGVYKAGELHPSRVFNL